MRRSTYVCTHRYCTWTRWAPHTYSSGFSSSSSSSSSSSFTSSPFRSRFTTVKKKVHRSLPRHLASSDTSNLGATFYQGRGNPEDVTGASASDEGICNTRPAQSSACFSSSSSLCCCIIIFRCTEVCRISALSGTVRAPYRMRPVADATSTAGTRTVRVLYSYVALGLFLSFFPFP